MLMPKPTQRSADRKLQVVVSVLSGEVSAATVACRADDAVVPDVPLRDERS